MRKNKGMVYFLLISVLIVMAASFWASSHPDGLEKVAEHLGFISGGLDGIGPMPDYTIPFLGETTLSTILAGLTGVLILWLSFYLFGKCLPKGHK